MNRSEEAGIVKLLHVSGHERFLPLAITPLAGDGSSRRFYRLVSGAETLIAVLPAGTGASDYAEARASFEIGRHLRGKMCAVPAVYGFDSDSSALIFEDLGDCRLQDCGEQEQRSLYLQAVRELAAINCCGAEDFSESWCWDTPCYDQQLMRERESDYFIRAFWRGVLEQDMPVGVEAEFAHLALTIEAEADAGFFLHRDCQSRNIMIRDGAVSFIDFQGGRRGPLGYDLASLLLDPYADLSARLQAELYQEYCSNLSRYISFSRDLFDHNYQRLACQRLLQIIGAFSWLSQHAKKIYYAQFIEPSLVSLYRILNTAFADEYPRLRATVETASALYRERKE